MSNSSFVLKTPYLRESFVRTGSSVTSIISETFQNTFVLATTSIGIALILGLFFGVFSSSFFGLRFLAVLLLEFVQKSIRFESKVQGSKQHLEIQNGSFCTSFKSKV